MIQVMLSSLCAVEFRLYAASFVFPSTIINQKRRYFYESPPIGRRASLFVTLQHQSALGNGEGSHNVNDDDHRINRAQDASHPLTLQPDKLIKKLESFIPNISRNRMAKKKRTLDPKSSKDEPNDYNVNDALINACTSLVYFLNNEADSLSSPDNITLQPSSETVESIREVLEMVLVQAVRAASEVGDFVLINKLIHAAVGYASAIARKTNNNAPLLTPRIFGEVITSISKTKASHSKVKSLWNWFIHDVAGDESPKILSSAPSSYELNAMLTSLGERNKVPAALTLYRRMVEGDNGGVRIEGDAYTASILFGMLADSIGNGVRNIHDRGNDFTAEDITDDVVSPCWQWQEAISLLDTFSSSQLNNFAYAALSKVNERATEMYCDAGARHNGVQCAMSVLERMKVSLF